MTLKIFLFAGIIGMMILPFSMMDFADAQNGPGEEDFADIGPVGIVEEHTAESHKLRIDIKKQDVLNLEI